MVVQSVFVQQKYFSVFGLTASGCSHVGSLLNNEELVAHDIMYMTAKHARHVNDISDMVKMAALTVMLS